MSAVIAAVCHDYDHDGFTNGFHVKSKSDRALRFDNKSVQENWHVAESLKIMEEFNFLEALTMDEVKNFKRRMTGMILATDMHHHAEHLKEFMARIEERGVCADKDNGHLFIDKTDSKTTFDS